MSNAAGLAITPLTAPPDATVTVPGSKSITNRALVAAALADGASTLHGVLFSDDTEAMLACLDALAIHTEPDRVARTVRVHGCAGVLPVAAASLDARRSGTTARFVVPLLANAPGAFRVDAHDQLRARPMAELVRALTERGATVESDDGALPFTITTSEALPGGVARVRGDVSSQFLSGLLLSAPAAREGMVIELDGPLVSRPYVDMTISVMRAFGADVIEHAGVFRVAPVGYRAVDYEIEPDASAASYFFAAAAITGGRVRVEGLGSTSVQGDLAFVDDLATMGATVTKAPTWTEVQGPADAELGGGSFDLASHSDTAPTLAAVAAFAGAPVTATGIGFIRQKESDRIAAVVTELRRCGVDASEDADGFTIAPSPHGPHGAVVATYDDHRMAMAMTLIGLRVPGIVICDPRCVDKTFPAFFEVLETLRRDPVAPSASTTGQGVGVSVDESAAFGRGSGHDG